MIRPLHAILVALPVLTIQPAAQSADRLSVRLAEAPGAGQPAPVAGWTETWTKPRPLRLHLLRVDLKDPRVEPCVLLGPDPDGAGPAEATLTVPGELADGEPGLLAAVNANAFAHLPTAPLLERGRGWFAGKAVDIQGLAAAGGSVRSPSQNGRVPLWFDRSGRPHLGAPSPEQPLHHGVADWGDLLVSGGENVAKPGLTIINQPSDGKPRAIPVMLGIRHRPAPDHNPPLTR